MHNFIHRSVCACEFADWANVCVCLHNIHFTLYSLSFGRHNQRCLRFCLILKYSMIIFRESLLCSLLVFYSFFCLFVQLKRSICLIQKHRHQATRCDAMQCSRMLNSNYNFSWWVICLSFVLVAKHNTNHTHTERKVIELSRHKWLQIDKLQNENVNSKYQVKVVRRKIASTEKSKQTHTAMNCTKCTVQTHTRIRVQ